MGAIDDSDPHRLRVIIPNYVYNPTNCVGGSSYYAVCCIDECEDLLASLESRFGRPELTATEIAPMLRPCRQRPCRQIGRCQLCFSVALARSQHIMVALCPFTGASSRSGCITLTL